ncbi:MAG: polyphosphate kinase 2 family protein [Ignavibacteria bacterium]|jgi:PPK2 family polyphosphate:nucleotide phosphotransferase|nr:polyphosphate kinase 2 family protein [Ignavibacteria bacterium]MCU7500473.1 polyphosphate kinase 2 family protein [Ignavibacteria bacterium]MCU7520974.1 polyphosphate kinase 2 family protein [Ignavibacteria bacterium]MCU7525077.1 polyphosphate kinase 2 family protein [Ignavibacteria bacterium]
MDIEQFLVKPDSQVKLKDHKTNDTGGYKSKEDAGEKLADNITQMDDLQAKLFAQDRYSLLLVFQAMDGGGKDSAIKHVMTGLNPQGTQVFSFKQPSKEELDHGFLWRISKALPEKGRIGIFNRSHYEEVLIVRVHDLVKSERLPEWVLKDNIWKMRFRQINDFERYLYETGTYVVKFFLNISKDEQKKRFFKRIEDPAKNWKITEEDIAEREYWDDYQKCYEDAISETSTEYAPWYIIPGDKKWFAHLAISEVIVKTMSSMDISFPKVKGKQLEALGRLKEKLSKE